MLNLKAKREKSALSMLLLIIIVIASVCVIKINTTKKSIVTSATQKTPYIKNINAVVIRKNELLLVSLYDKNKNRVHISNEKSFNITFIENWLGVQLKDILGYSKNEYNSNSNYPSENEPINNIFNEIYIKSCNDSDNLNKFYTNLSINSDSDKIFKYFYCNINDKNSFNDKMSFNVKEPIYNMNVQLYYKLNNKIIKFIKKIDFNILLKVNVMV